MKILARRRLLGVALAVAVAAVLVPMAYGTLSEDDGPAVNIGTGFILLSEAQLRAPTQVDAFIPTRSGNRKCLVTLAESNFAVAGTTVYCAARNFNGVDGIRVVALFTQDVPSPLILAVTAYQQGARRYGPPVLYTGN